MAGLAKKSIFSLTMIIYQFVALSSSLSHGLSVYATCFKQQFKTRYVQLKLCIHVYGQ